VIGHDLVSVVGVEHLHVVTCQAGGVAIAVEAQPDQVAVELADARKVVLLGPVEWVLVVEPLVLQELLPLEDHRDAGCGEHQGRAQRRLALGKPVACIARGDLLRDARPAVRHLVVRFGVDHAVERIQVVTMY